MDNQKSQGTNSGESGPPEGKGYQTPGQDTILHSSSPAVPTPSMPSESRLQTPPTVIDAIGETPADSNPALDETVGFEEGRTSTADLLLARETAEEQPAGGNSGTNLAQDSGSAPEELRTHDAGRPNWPDDREEPPLEYMESPRANMPFLAGGQEPFGSQIEGRQDRAADLGSSEASVHESRTGLPESGMDMEEDNYERREGHAPSTPSELDQIAPGMKNIAPEENNEQ